MDDDIDVILQDKRIRVHQQQLDKPIFTACTGALLLGVYRLWTVFALPGFRKVPISLKVPYLSSSKTQTQNVLKLLRGRRGCLVDLGSGDGRLVFAASAVGLHCTGYEINSILTTSARLQAWWRGVPPTSALFVCGDFWKTDLSDFNNVTAFLAPGVMEVLGQKLLMELHDDARVVACRFPFPQWPSTDSQGQGLDQAWAYDMAVVRQHIFQNLPGIGRGTDTD